MYRLKYESPIGWLEISETEDAVSHLIFHDIEPQFASEDTPLLKRTAQELSEYFHGKRKHFDLPLILNRTYFRMKVWNELLNIPYGYTITYGELAANIGNPKASRAVGQANHHNPISIIIPCHRVIGADGSMTGYGGELWRKEWLLEFERRNR
ncbi:MAG TPA: methylated-DNA--[protein]-cysteine S-methyltransferase [Candidatus Cloacimonadota bacterium]|nr:methylated-DNA--[protein]-cysteine S-methyltransferase [Candidatus Cloacimonadota bacterium]HPT71339.1 methylated-DNA--[protein]-cysteine S-methyltransferase [Candidatus Cloacimonadota bacterium]